MPTIIQKVEILLEKHSTFEAEFWNDFKKVNNENQYEFAKVLTDELIGFGQHVQDHKRIQQILALVQGIYPFDDSNILELCHALLQAFNGLLNQPSLISKRDHLLYLITDILFHSPEIIEKSDQKSYAMATIKMGGMKYELDNATSDSYLKNYQALGYLYYFKDKDIQSQIKEFYTSHFDPRIREDLIDNEKTLANKT